MDWKSWSLMRILRIAFAIYAIYYSIETKEWGWLLFAALLIWQAYTNASCGCGCQGGSCTVSENQKTETKKEIDHDEKS